MALRLLPFRQYAETDVINMFALQSDSVNENVTGVGSGDNGVWVKVTQGGMNDGPTTYDDTYASYLGAAPGSNSYIGKNQYPRVTTEVGVANSGDHTIGVTLYQTAKRDENGEKLLYYPQKRLETQSCLPGESVPVLSRGIVSVACGGPFSSGAINSAGCLDITEHVNAGNGKPTADIVGMNVALRPDQGADFGKGQLQAQLSPSVTIGGGGGGAALTGLGGGSFGGLLSGQHFGTVLATGSRIVNSGQVADQFAGSYANSNGGGATGYYAIIQFDTNRVNGKYS